MRRLVMGVALGFVLTLASTLTGCSKHGERQRSRAADTGIPPEHAVEIVQLFNRGVALMDRFQPGDAARAFDAVVRLAPGWTTGRLDLGIALLNIQSDSTRARAEKELRQVVAQDPDNPYAHYGLGMLLRHQTRLEAAKAEFERVLAIDPEDADSHYQLGILVMDSDPAAARRHLEKTLEKMPHHESACYRLQTLLRKAGEEEKARELLARFEALKAAHAGVASGMKYGEMGRYGEVIRAFGVPEVAGAPQVAPLYTDTAEKDGLGWVAVGPPGWPGRSAVDGAAAFAPGVAVADVDGDADLDVYITGVGTAARGGISNAPGALFLGGGPRFMLARASGVDGRQAIGAWFGDYDADGDPDLYLTCAGPNRLYRNDGKGRFTDVTRVSGTSGGDVQSVGAAWADADHDGDLDLYVANRAAPNALFRNNGDDTFTDVTMSAGVDCGAAASTGVLFFDADGDLDLDLYVINDGSANRLFLNDRIGRYTDATSRFPELADAGPGLGAALGDVDLNGHEDLLLVRGEAPPRLLLQVDRGRFQEDGAFEQTAASLGGATGGLLGDLDLDGDLDIVLLGATHSILMNRGDGTFDAPVALGLGSGAPDARGAAAVDLDGDGSLELLVARAGARPQLWRAPTPAGRRWLEVVPSREEPQGTNWLDPAAAGLQVEVKTGRHLQVASLVSASGYLGGLPGRLHFGLGENGKADYVRLAWPDAALQSELEVSADQIWRVHKVKRKASSCPILFTWNGDHFAFVTDFLGVGGLGFFIEPGVYAPPDPTEDVRIPPEMLSPRAGRYLLRVAEPLEEVTYLDEVHLLAYDHPNSLEVQPDERFTGTPPFATGEPHAIATKIFPVSARDDRGADVLERLLEIDRRYVAPVPDRRFPGYARDNVLELDFGDRLRQLGPKARLLLCLYGWVEYTYSHVNYAAYQAGVALHSPSIEVPDGHGGWRVAIPDAGFPAGMPRLMTLDITSLWPGGSSARLRLRSNMELYWDQIFVAEDVPQPALRVRSLRPCVAELRHLGYPREFSPDGADPTLYDYQRLDQGVPFKNLSGNLTRFGDVLPLLDRGDDCFVILGRGEEIALEFDAGELPALPAGWARTFVLHSEGYCKDMDLYTAFPHTVEPLPYRAMSNYPPPGPAPVTAAWREYQRTWNTRRSEGN